MAKETFINKAEDLQWLKDTHLKGIELPDFKSFLLYGNEDCPDKLELHKLKMPAVYATPVASFFLQEDGSYKQSHEAIWYHGTEHEFKTFDWSKIGSMMGCPSPGFWFHSKRDGADYFGGNIIEVRLKYLKPKDVSNDEFVEYGWGPTNWAKQAYEEECDAVIIRNIIDGFVHGDVVCVFKPEQIEIVRFIKAADDSAS